MIFSRWKKLMSSFGFTENEAAFNSIVRQHSEAYRAYHNVAHISDCLLKLDLLGEELEDRNVIELALWFHDIIYDPYGKENEQKSADRASDFLKEAGASEETQKKVIDLILATRHTVEVNSACVPPEASAEAQEEKIMTDIDLSILGSKPEDYDTYVDKIRKEYKLVPGPIFRKKRKEILSEFLNRDPLFHTRTFHEKYEKQAKENLARELERYS